MYERYTVYLVGRLQSENKLGFLNFRGGGEGEGGYSHFKTYSCSHQFLTNIYMKKFDTECNRNLIINLYFIIF